MHILAVGGPEGCTEVVRMMGYGGPLRVSPGDGNKMGSILEPRGRCQDRLKGN